MKKLFFLVALFTTICVTNAAAQDAQGDAQATMVDKFKQRVGPQLMEKAQLTEAEADKVIKIHLAYMKRKQSMDNGTEEQKKTELAHIQAAENKEYSAIPLTEAKIKAVNDFWSANRKPKETLKNN